MTNPPNAPPPPPGRDLGDFTFTVKEAAELTAADRATVHALFDVAYRQANHAYLDKSLGRLRYIATAMRGDTPAGFALGETRIMDLPRLPDSLVTLAGICCIAPEFRRRGLFGYLERLALGAGFRPEYADRRRLACGRMAHPASMRTMGSMKSIVPRYGVEPTPWQQEVGAAVADAYGVHAFDPRTFVCIGAGTPIGYPVMEMDVTDDEWRVFAPVDRDRGDALLGIAWMPDAPPGWDT